MDADRGRQRRVAADGGVVRRRPRCRHPETVEQLLAEQIKLTKT